VLLVGVDYDAKTTIQVSNRIRLRLKTIAGCRGCTYEDVLDELTQKELSRTKIESDLKASPKAK
jgi:hypothetical protein